MLLVEICAIDPARIGQRLGLGVDHRIASNAGANQQIGEESAKCFGGGSTSRPGGPAKRAPSWRRVLADRERLLGPEHHHTLTTRANLASSYRQAGRTGEAITLLEAVLADRERLLGPGTPTHERRAALRAWRRCREAI